MVLKVYIWKERRFCSTVGLSFKIYNMLIYGLYVNLVTIQQVQLLVVELVTFCKKYCLVKKNNSY